MGVYNNWKIQIDVSDLWEYYYKYKDFDTFNENLIKRLQENAPMVYKNFGDNVIEEYEDFIDILNNDVINVDDFDNIWLNIFEWANQNNIRIKTI